MSVPGAYYSICWNSTQSIRKDVERLLDININFARIIDEFHRLLLKRVSNHIMRPPFVIAAAQLSLHRSQTSLENVLAILKASDRIETNKCRQSHVIELRRIVNISASLYLSTNVFIQLLISESKDFRDTVTIDFMDPMFWIDRSNTLLEGYDALTMRHLFNMGLMGIDDVQNELLSIVKDIKNPGSVDFSKTIYEFHQLLDRHLKVCIVMLHITRHLNSIPLENFRRRFDNKSGIETENDVRQYLEYSASRLEDFRIINVIIESDFGRNKKELPGIWCMFIDALFYLYNDKLETFLVKIYSDHTSSCWFESSNIVYEGKSTKNRSDAWKLVKDVLNKVELIPFIKTVKSYS